MEDIILSEKKANKEKLDNEKEELEKFLFNQGESEEEITERQWQILNAAVKIFSEKGFDGSRTSDIAKEADIAEGTIFRYYKTKKDILKGLMIPVTAKVLKPLIFRSLQKIMEDDEGKTVNEVLEEIVLDRIKLVRKNFPLLKIVAIESIYHPDIFENLRNEIAPKILPAVEKFIEKQIKEKRIRDFEPRLVTRTIISVIFGYIFTTSFMPEQFPAKDDKEEAKVLVDIILNGIKNA